MKKQLTQAQRKTLLDILQKRFEKNMKRHKGIEWDKVQAKLELAANAGKLWSLNEMEQSGGEPDVIAPAAGGDKKKTGFTFYDCSPESPKERRSLCYDHKAQVSRKEHQPENNVIDKTAGMGIDLLTEEQYRHLQTFGVFDAKTSSWIETPAEIRKLGGALFCDYRYDTVFVYHNGAQSYYAARGFRGILEI